MKIRRDKNHVAIFETTKDRITFTILCIAILILMALATITFSWLPYWIVTGKNLYSTLIKL